MRLPIHKAVNHRGQLGDAVIGNAFGPNRTVALYGNKNSLFGCGFAARVNDAFLIPGFASYVFLIKFNDPT